MLPEQHRSWTGIITTNNGGSIIVVYTRHVRGASIEPAYSQFKQVFSIFTEDLSNTGRQGGFISEPSAYEDVIAGGADNFLRFPVGAEGQYVQALWGDYNRRIEDHNKYNATDQRLTLIFDNYEPSMKEQFHYLRNIGVIGATDVDCVVAHYLGKHLSQYLDRYARVPPRLWPLDEVLKAEINTEIKSTFKALNSIGLGLGDSPHDALHGAYKRIFHVAPNLRDPEFWRIFSFPWENSEYANRRIPHPLIRMGYDLFELRDSSVARGVVRDYIDGNVHGLLIQGEEHGIGQMTRIRQALDERGFAPRIYSLNQDNSYYIPVSVLDEFLREAHPESPVER